MNLLFFRSTFLARRVNTPYFTCNQRLRAVVAVSLAFTLLLTSLGMTGSAQTASAFADTSDAENEHFVIYVDKGGEMVCREATPSEGDEMDRVRSPKDLRQINHDKLNGLSASENAGSQLTIILLATANLDANAAAKAAFTRAAANWESRITSPVTLYMEADVGPNFFGGAPWGSGVLGQTTASSNTINYSVVRDRLISGADTPAKLAVYNALPTSSVPTDVNNATSVSVSRQIQRAIGLLDATATSGDSPPRIGFNSAVNFDFDASDGITAGQFDFEAIATHEIGHALGFTSRAGSGGNTIPAMWDLYRFRSGTTSGTFTSAQRIMTIGGPTTNSQYYFVPGETELGLSDGGPSGVTDNNADGNQSSHWRQRTLNGGVLIGIMDPRIPSGTRRVISDNDTNALSIFGYNSNSVATSPPPNDNFAAAQTISGCAGTTNGSNIAATKESGEPDHASNGGTRSVWYQWQAPATSSVNFTTAGSGFDTTLGVYTGSAVNSLSLIGDNDDVTPGVTNSSVTFNATAGVTYRIAVAGFNNSGSGGDVGPIVLNWDQSNCSGNTWVPTVLNSSQVELKSWKVDGRTFVYAKLTFSDAGFRVGNWGTPTQAGNNFTDDALIERWTGGSAQVITSTAQIWDLGAIAAGDYTFTFKNSGTTVKTLNFTVSALPPAPNPIDDARTFVFWQYKDFLRRDPDGPGWDHWTGEITLCSDPTKRNPGETEADCVQRKRANTSGAFFLSPEFQNTGYFALRVYRGSLGRMPFFGGSGTAQDEFTRDATTLGQGIVVNFALDPAVINANKQAFVNEFVTRAEFKAIYDGLNNTQYVDKLFQTTGVTPSAADRQALINGLNGGSETRATVLFKVVDGTTTGAGGVLTFNTTYGKAFYDNLFNSAFVQMEYFGYLLRDPDSGGYAFWLGKLNFFGNFTDAEMVKAFINSPEYRSRFGAP